MGSNSRSQDLPETQDVKVAEWPIIAYFLPERLVRKQSLEGNGNGNGK
jgi:hypothetical protein